MTAPSTLSVTPLMYPFSMQEATIWANSNGLPALFIGVAAVMSCYTFFGMLRNIGVANPPGAIVTTLMP